MNTLQRLAIVTALDKRIYQVKQQLRQEAVTEAAEQYRNFGATTFKPHLDGKQLATVSLKNAEAKATITDEDALCAWAVEYGMPTVRTPEWSQLQAIVQEKGWEWIDANLPELFVERAVLPDDFTAGLLNRDGKAFDPVTGDEVAGVEFVQKPYEVAVSKVDTDAIIGALWAGRLSVADAIALPEGEDA